MMTAHLSRRTALTAALATLGLAATACTSDDPGGASASGTASGGADLIPVTIGAVFTTAAVPFWVAQDQGIFAKNGLPATITQAGAAATRRRTSSPACRRNPRTPMRVTKG